MTKIDQTGNPNVTLRSGILLGLFVTILCLVGGELVLRHWFPMGGVILQRDARYLYKYIPNSRKQSTPHPEIGLERVLLTINREGRRGETVSAGRRPRIIVYGDSFIAGERTPLKQTFVYRLEGMLAARLSKPVQVINAGVVGYGPDQESLVMEDEIDTLKPDLVIAAIYSGNDYGDLIRNKLYSLDEHQELIAGRPVLDASVMSAFADAEGQSRFQIVRHFKNALERLRTSAIAGNVRKIFHRGGASGGAGTTSSELWGTPLIQHFLVVRGEEQNAVLKHDRRVDNLFFDTYDADVSLEPRSAAARYKRVLMERMMERLQSIAARHSTPLVFLFIPAAIDAADWDLSIDARIFPQYRRSELTDVLECIATSRHMAHLNLFGPFYEHRAEMLYNRRPEDHWNAKGQQMAAHLMADYIAQNNLLVKASSR